MTCAGLSCRQGRSKCETPWTCGGYANEAHYSAMHAAPGSFYPRDTASDEAADTPPVTPESAIGMALRLGKTAAIVIAAVAAAWAAAWYFPAWPWLVDKLAF